MAATEAVMQSRTLTFDRGSDMVERGRGGGGGSEAARERGSEGRKGGREGGRREMSFLYF